MWQAFLKTPTVAALADFAIHLLSIVVNQAGLECNFSDLKIKKSNIRNHIKIKQLEKMAKESQDSSLTSDLTLNTTPSFYRLAQASVHGKRNLGWLVSARNGRTTMMQTFVECLQYHDMQSYWMKPALKMTMMHADQCL